VGGDIEYRLLGAVGVWEDGQQQASLTAQQRSVLAALLLEPGRDVSLDRFTSLLWSEEPPRSARNILQISISKLRRALPASHQAALRTTATGYRLEVDHHRVDLHRFRELTARARTLPAAEASPLLHAALRLWRGQALADVTPTTLSDALAASLNEERLTAVERCAAVDLRLGAHHEVAAELSLLVAEHPLRERLAGLLMTALHRCGRRAEALAVFHQVRDRFAEELGVDPGEDLQRTFQDILNDRDAAPEPSPAPAIPPPAQLPGMVADFTGRDALAAELAHELRMTGKHATTVAAVAGIGGVGKTTLVVGVAHAVREHFPDGQLYVDLQGATRTPTHPEEVLGSFLRALGTPDDSIPQGAAERSALYRSLLDSRRVLILLDNARDAAQVRPLLPGTDGCATLVTSRHRMVDLAGARLFDLDVMGPEEALTLFTRIVGEERAGVERNASMDVVGACGFLPLAIRIAASRLASRRTWTVSDLARKLSDERRRLDELQIGDQGVRASFELGYGQLDTGQARAFRLLSLPDGPDVSLDAAAALLDCDHEAAEAVVESLVDASLLESASRGRYRFHNLVRLFARDRAEREDRGATREAALTRLLDFYLSTTARVYALQRPGARLVAHLAETVRPGIDFASRKSAVDWLFTEAGSLLPLAQQCTDSSRLRKAADLLLAAKDLMESGAFAAPYERTCYALLDTSMATGDSRAEARVRMALSSASDMAGRFDSGYEHARQALLLGREVNDTVSVSEGANACGLIALQQDRHADAERYLMIALEAYREDGDLPGEASILACLSSLNLRTHRTEAAVQLAQETVEILRRFGSPLRLANGQYTLAVALSVDGQHAAAISLLNQSLASFRSSRQRLWEGLTLYRLAEAHLRAEEPSEAVRLAEQSLAQLRSGAGLWRRACVLVVLGKALDAMGIGDRARACWEQALEIFEERDSPERSEVRGLLAGTGPPAAAPTPYSPFSNPSDD
jgi:DNA-binding SARP family transcriptional activator